MKEKKINSKLIIAIIATILAVVIIPSGIYCLVAKESPVQMMSDMFVSTDKQIVGKWQSDSGVSAYEFYEDGSYDSYLSTFSYSGNYVLDGNKITLTNPATSGHVVYKVDVTEKKLTLTLFSENGVEAEEKEKLEFERVSHISTKPINDLLSDLVDEVNEKAE